MSQNDEFTIDIKDDNKDQDIKREIKPENNEPVSNSLILEVDNYLYLETGDIVLFKGTSWYSRLIEYFGESRYSHVGFILKNPTFLEEKGVYLLHSSSEMFPDYEDKKDKFGVRIDKLSDIMKYDGKICEIYYRKCSFERTSFFYQKLEELHTIIHNKPYNVNLEDWLVAKLSLDEFDVKSLNKCCKRGNNTSSFWCSALVTYLYFNLGLLHNKEICWNYIAPKEFTKEGNNYLHFRYCLDDVKQICIPL